jgi:hypothetical protein
MKIKKEKNKDNFVPGLIIIVFVIFIGIVGLYYLQKLSVNNGRICTYLGRLWVPDKDKNDPDLYRCYTYEEYYEYKE